MSKINQFTLPRRTALLFGFVLLAAGSAGAQISLTTLGTPVTQNFDTLATSGTTNAWTDNSVIPGWYAAQTAGTLSVYRASDGTSNAGGIHSFGTGTNAERALGSIGSGTPQNLVYAARLVNNTGATLTSLDVAYTGEQWRNGGNITAQKLDFQYQVADAGVITGANLPTTGWIDFDALDFTGPIATATAAALDGNLGTNQAALSSSIALSANVGQEVWIRWFDTNDAGNDRGLGIDGLSVTPQGVLPPPNLSIDDVAVTEGNAGTVTASFTVSLSAPAPAGGVSFDITTNDGSATVADNDYVAQSLSGQTIAAGNQTYTFDVLVNGDTAFEPNETFTVNVSNVSGASLLDGQGVGTINNDDTASDLSVTVSVAPNPVMPGDTVTYTVNGNNAGPDAATNAQVALTFATEFASLSGPAGWSCSTPAIGAAGTVSCTIASLPLGAFNFSVQATVPFGTTPGDLGANASISADNSDPSPANNTNATVVTVVAGPSLPVVPVPLLHGQLALWLAALFLGLGLVAVTRRNL